MADVANQDEAKKCLEIASANLQAGHLDKAFRFAEKAMRLYPNDEVSPKYPFPLWSVEHAIRTRDR